jgi:hypothetical protein
VERCLVSERQRQPLKIPDRQKTSYMFRPYLVAIFREMLRERYITKNSKPMFKYIKF